MWKRIGVSVCMYVLINTKTIRTTCLTVGACVFRGTQTHIAIGIGCLVTNSAIKTRIWGASIGCR